MHKLSARITFCVLMVTLPGAGCEVVELSPYSRLDELRVMAILAEPPVVSVDGTTLLSALVYLPGDDIMEYKWSWCPYRGGPEDEYECAATEDQLQALLDPDSDLGFEVSYYLGNNEVAVLTHVATPDLLSQFCLPTEDATLSTEISESVESTDGSFLVNCDSGFPISIELTVTAGDEELRAFKQVYLSLGEDTPMNANPHLGALRVGDESAVYEDATVISEVAGSFGLEVGRVYSLFVDIPAGVAQTYTPAGDDATEKTESLTVSWFSTHGTFEQARTMSGDEEMVDSALTQNQWDLSAMGPAIPNVPAELYLVIRDGRGGVDWIRRTITLLGPEVVEP